MKTFQKIALLTIVSLFCLIIYNNVRAATTTVGTEQDLRDAINNATDGDIIELSNNISLTSPIEITDKTITINGNGHTITRIETNWSPNGSNGSLITAGGDGTVVTLSNMTLTGAHKYGAQSYNGAHLILNNVNVSANGFGGILVNAGTLEVKSLSLGKNGSPSNNGIEIAKGSGVTGNNSPILIMNGTLSSTENENVVYLAENDSLITFEVRNTDSTTNKIFVQGQKVVLTDSNNNIIFESNENPNITVTGTTFSDPSTTTTPDPSVTITPSPSPTETVTPTPEPTTSPVPENKTQEKNHATPKTGSENYLGVAVILLLLAVIGLFYTRKKQI